MSAETYQKILDEVNEIHYLMILGDSKSSVVKLSIERILMTRHNLNRNDACSFTNLVETYRNHVFCSGENGLEWIADRSEPNIENYPEVLEFLREK